MSYNYPPNLGAGGENNSAGNRREREGRVSGVSNGNGAQPPVSTGRSYSGGSSFEEMISSMRELFAQDRQIASQSDSKRCGICYLYFTVSELTYREEGFYICSACIRTLGKQTLHMVRQQQK